MSLKNLVKSYIEEPLTSLIWLLSASYGCSLLAEYFWVFDLFSHFLIQYVLIALTLGGLSLIFNKYKSAALMVCIALLSLVESRLNLQHPLQFFPTVVNKQASALKQIKLVQYNHNVEKGYFKNLKTWLTINADEFDVIVLQEATSKTSDMAKTIKDIYPYQIHEARERPFGMVILSRYPISNYSLTDLPCIITDNFIIKAAIEIPEIDEPLVIYAIHAMPPHGLHLFEQRNMELSKFGEMVSEDKHRYIVMIGDWNVTPYSPFFSKLLKTSGLNFQATGLFLNPTWSNDPLLYPLRIPIDHVLYSDSLQFLNKEIAPNFQSDHNAMITTLRPL